MTGATTGRRTFGQRPWENRSHIIPASVVKQNTKGRSCSAAGKVTADLPENVHGFGHSRADCRGPGSGVDPYARIEYGTTFTLPLWSGKDFAFLALTYIISSPA